MSIERCNVPLIIHTPIHLLRKKPQQHTHMGVSKGEGGGRWSPPNGWQSLVLGEGGPCRIWRSGGFPNFPGKSSPSSPSPPSSTPFSPSTLSFNSFIPQTPPSNSLEQAFISLFYPPNSLFLPPTSLNPIGPSPNTSGIPP